VTGTLTPSAAEAAMTAPASEEAPLVAALKAGDAAAFETLVRTHAGRMLAVARRFLRSESDAADAVQEAFVSAFRSIGRFAGDSRLSTWLHRITVNAALMRLRSESRRPAASLEDLQPRFDDTGHHAAAVPSWSPGPVSEAESAELRRRVRERIDELPEPHRTVLLLRDIEEFDTERTAELLGITPGAVKTRLHRARLALRTLLEPMFTARA
jgi:RNA polymerase sigma-70 factor (ECF subfamily)